MKYKALFNTRKLNTMKISKTKFVIVFLLSAFVFQFISNAVLGPEVRLFPRNGEWFPGTGSPIGWKNTLAAILYPVKFVMIGPLSFLAQDPDPAPPVLFLAFAFYWTVIAFVLYYFLSKIVIRKRA